MDDGNSNHEALARAGRLGGLTAWGRNRERKLDDSARGGKAAMDRHGGRAHAYRMAMIRWHPASFGPVPPTQRQNASVVVSTSSTKICTRYRHSWEHCAPECMARKGKHDGLRPACCECATAYRQIPEVKAKKKADVLANRLDKTVEVFALQGNACWRCGEDNLSILEEHHTKGGDMGSRPSAWPLYPPELRCCGSTLIRAILKWVEDHGELPPDIELLCPNCHRKTALGL